MRLNCFYLSLIILFSVIINYKPKLYIIWEQILLGYTRKLKRKYQFKNYTGKIYSFDSQEELDNFLQEYFIYYCELSNNY